MSKKTIFSIVTVLGITAILVGLVNINAFAKGSATDENQGRFPRFRLIKPSLGSIISLGNHEFTIQRADGMELTFQIDDETQFRGLQKTELSFDDLQTGDWVTVRPNRNAGDASLARLVVVMPDGFDPAEQRTGRGKILKIDTVGNTFTVQTRRGEILVAVNSSTIYKGPVSEFSDLQVGMQVAVVAQKTGESGIVAEIVRAGLVDRTLKGDGRFTGLVTELGSNQFTIKDRKGETINFQASPETIYLLGLRSKAAFADVKVGSRVLVTAEKLEDGSYKALVVVISPARDLI